ncbi:MAG: HAMP domain-containing sensor histidine kinase [Acholeplasmataceae bacterium]|jgi:two-component system sensor histidine kinase CssS|nr:HAMP domain-containing sensor histidine kinase [Acholeplasmataceae bacterium]
MKEMKLTTQLNIIFTVVTLLTSFIFLVLLNRVFDAFRVEQNEQQFEFYYENLFRNYETPPDSPYNGFVIAYDGVVVNSDNLEILENKYSANELVDMFSHTTLVYTRREVIEHETFYFRVNRQDDGTMIVAFTGEDYLSIVGKSFNMIVRISFIALVLLGNLIILIWSRITVERVKRLKGEIERMTLNSYKVPIEIDGNDEITDLSLTIEKMRREIQSSEKTKQEMLQNISHDFKTPIAVIQSYAEAIYDGVSDIEEASVIVKQAELLNVKVKQLLELNKLEYLKDQNEFEEVSIKEIVQNIVDNHKYRTELIWDVSLDDSIYYGVKENFYTAFNNIVDNAIRYAKTRIEIKLKNKKLTFYNDGEPINQKFIDELFKPYEKGKKGEFGLGMSIAQKTCSHFNLILKVENINDGVMFTIEPM